MTSDPDSDSIEWKIYMRSFCNQTNSKVYKMSMNAAGKTSSFVSEYRFFDTFQIYIYPLNMTNAIIECEITTTYTTSASIYHHTQCPLRAFLAIRFLPFSFETTGLGGFMSCRMSLAPSKRVGRWVLLTSHTLRLPSSYSLKIYMAYQNCLFVVTATSLPPR